MSTSEGCTPPATSMFKAKYCDGEFCASTSFLSRRSATVLMLSRTTMPSPPLDQSICWKMRGMATATCSLGWPVLSTMPSMNKRNHVERAPADVDVAAGVGAEHGHRVVDDHQLDLELLAIGRFPDLLGLGAVVGQDDRGPAGPDVQGEADRVVLQRLVARGLLDLRQALGRLEAVLLDRGHRRGAVGRFGVLVRGPAG